MIEAEHKSAANLFDSGIEKGNILDLMGTIGTWEWDRVTGEMVVSEGFCRLLGLDSSTKAITRKGFFDLFFPDDIPPVRENDRLHLKTGDPYEISFRAFGKSGDILWLNERGYSLKDRNGTVVKTLGIIQDITAKRNDHLKIAKLMKQNETIFNGSQDALTLVEVTENGFFCLLCNEAFTSKTGIGRLGEGKCRLRELFGEQSGAELDNCFRECLQKKEPVSFEQALELPVGPRIWKVTLTPFFEGEVIRHIVMSGDDITERKQASNRLLMNLDHSKKLLDLISAPWNDRSVFLDRVLSLALDFTGSKTGYIFFYEEEKQELTLHAWLTEHADSCAITERQTVYQLEATGLWGEVVRQRKPILLNDYEAPHPLKKGLPKGHIPLKNYLSVPVFDKNKIVAVVGVGNKTGDYDEDDILDLNLLMNNAWGSVERKRSDDLLKGERDLLKATLLSIGEGIIVTDAKGSITIINEVAQQLTGWKQRDAVGTSFQDVYYTIEEASMRKRDNIIQPAGSAFLRDIKEGNIILISKDGTRRPIAENVSPVLAENGVLTGAIVAFRDITMENQKLETIEYFIYHDQLTGIYNRAFYEAEKRRLDTARNLPLTVVMADVNGLKLTNDAFGHQVGDRLLQKAADVIRSCCREDEIVARLGGDEFVILLPHTGSEDAEKIVERIRKLCSETFVNSVMLSISFGWETKKKLSEEIEVTQKKAEDRMYRRKLFESPSMRGKMIDAITHTLYEVQGREKIHSQRVGALCELFAKSLGYGDRDVGNIKTAGLLHDIGKIAIDSRILDKSSPLTEQEILEIRRHPEIGYRIVGSVNDLSDIAQTILAHQESYDGTGYPKALKGEEIPIEARIVAIANAFDSMRTPMSYRTAMTEQEALCELVKFAGTQFDPRLTGEFIKNFPLWKKTAPLYEENGIGGEP